MIKRLGIKKLSITAGKEFAFGIILIYFINGSRGDSGEFIPWNPFIRVILNYAFDRLSHLFDSSSLNILEK